MCFTSRNLHCLLAPNWTQRLSSYSNVCRLWSLVLRYVFSFAIFYSSYWWVISNQDGKTNSCLSHVGIICFIIATHISYRPNSKRLNCWLFYFNYKYFVSLTCKVYHVIADDQFHWNIIYLYLSHQCHHYRRSFAKKSTIVSFDRSYFVNIRLFVKLYIYPSLRLRTNQTIPIPLVRHHFQTCLRILEEAIRFADPLLTDQAFRGTTDDAALSFRNTEPMVSLCEELYPQHSCPLADDEPIGEDETNSIARELFRLAPVTWEGYVVAPPGNIALEPKGIDRSPTGEIPKMKSQPDRTWTLL